MYLSVPKIHKQALSLRREALLVIQDLTHKQARVFGESEPSDLQATQLPSRRGVPPSEPLVTHWDMVSSPRVGQAGCLSIRNQWSRLGDLRTWLRLFVCLSVCLLIYLSVYLSTYLSLSLSLSLPSLYIYMTYESGYEYRKLELVRA